MTAMQVVDVLRRYRLASGDEAMFQRSVQAVLASTSVSFEAEYSLSGGRGRIDFLLPETGVGIECKVQGSPSAVAEQLLRYAEAPEVRELILLTARARLGDLPPTLAGVPLLVHSTWRTSL